MEKHTVTWEYKGVGYVFHTLDTLFSYKHIDIGTIQMLEYTELRLDDKILDLGCGYGVVGIVAASTIGSENIVMSDVNANALEMSVENVNANSVDGIRIVCSNGFENIRDTDFTLIMSNPPYHTDFSVAKAFIEGSYKHLKAGGRLVMVTKRFDWYKNKIQAVFGGVKWIESSGYYVFLAEKQRIKKEHKKRALSKKLMRKYRRIS